MWTCGPPCLPNSFSRSGPPGPPGPPSLPDPLSPPFQVTDFRRLKNEVTLIFACLCLYKTAFLRYFCEISREIIKKKI